MYLSHLAKTPQRVHVWVVAPHRVERVDADARRVPSALRFAGPATGLTGALGDFVGTGKWLTEYEALVSQPATITADWEFSAAATDVAFREVENRVEPVYILGIPGGWFIIGSAVSLLLVMLAVVVVVRRKPAATRANP